MAIKRKGILATPGKYTYGDKTEYKSAKELRDAVERQPIIMLTKNHPDQYYPRAKDFIGTVSQKWDEKNQKVMGDFWFYDERITDELKQQLLSNKPVPISAGFTVDEVKDGMQEGIVYTHVAVLTDEDPKCPLGKCGVNVRMESNSETEYRYEQKSEIQTEPEEPETAEKESPDYVTIEQFDELKEMLSNLTESLKPVEQEPKVKEEQAEVQQQVEPEPEPEIEIPAGEPDTRPWTETDDGWIEITPRPTKQE